MHVNLQENRLKAAAGRRSGFRFWKETLCTMRQLHISSHVPGGRIAFPPSGNWVTLEVRRL